MRITTNHLDILAYETQHAKPAMLLERRSTEVWVVRETPLETDLAAPWSLTNTEEHVRIPLFPYLVDGHEPATAIALGGKLALRFIWELQHALDPGAVVVRTHLCVGHPVQDLNMGLRFWFGLAAQLHRPET